LHYHYQIEKNDFAPSRRHVDILLGHVGNQAAEGGAGRSACAQTFGAMAAPTAGVGPWLEGDAREAAEAWLERLGEASLAQSEAGVRASRGRRDASSDAASYSGGRTPTGSLDALVMEFLVTEGHRDAAAVFSEEGGIPLRCDLDEVDRRAQVRAALEAGDVSGAIDAAEKTAPGVLRSRPRLVFDLQRQRFVELLRRGQPFEALEFAQTVLAPLCVPHPAFLPELAKTVGLLAFESPEEAPHGADLMDMRSRMRISGALNAALLSGGAEGAEGDEGLSEGGEGLAEGGEELTEGGGGSPEATPRLSGLIQLLIWMQRQLDSAGATYLKINEEDLLSCRATLPEEKGGSAEMMRWLGRAGSYGGGQDEGGGDDGGEDGGGGEDAGGGDEEEDEEDLDDSDDDDDDDEDMGVDEGPPQEEPMEAET